MSKGDFPGIVAVTYKEEVFLKITCKCLGENHAKLAVRLFKDRECDAKKAYAIALKVGFGCYQCLVVSYAEDNLYSGEVKLPWSYWEKLQDSEFHPGEKGGVSRFYSVLDYPVKTKKK